jgi:hypothetical protein
MPGGVLLGLGLAAAFIDAVLTAAPVRLPLTGQANTLPGVPLIREREHRGNVRVCGYADHTYLSW